MTFERTRVQVAKRIAPAAGFARSSPLQAPFTLRATWAFDRARDEAPDLVDPEQIRVAVTQLLNPAEPDYDAAG